MAMLSIVIPTLNESDNLAATLAPLQALRRRGCEVIVVDGGSEDGTLRIAAPLADQVLTGPRGRARQMNAGARTARSDVLWFLHADTAVPADALDQMQAALAGGAHWGRFDVRLSGSQRMLRVVEWMMNRRSCLTGIATGDQGMFVRREVFESVGGFPEIPLMEDVALSRLLKGRGRPACLPGPLVTSSRRWERHGIMRTILLMWRLRLAYFLGADPGKLHRRYYGRKLP